MFDSKQHNFILFFSVSSQLTGVGNDDLRPPNSKFNTRQKLRKYFSNEHKIRDAHLQCVNNHYAKFEYKGMKSV